MTKAERQYRYLVAVLSIGSVRHAARAAGISESLVYYWRHTDSAFTAEERRRFDRYSVNRIRARHIPCPSCREPFDPRPNGKDLAHCSRQCAGKTNTRCKQKRCPTCNEKFQPRRMKQRFCSPGCVVYSSKLEADERREVYLHHFAITRRVGQAAAAAGVRPDNIPYWRKHYPSFARREAGLRSNTGG